MHVQLAGEIEPRESDMGFQGTVGRDLSLETIFPYIVRSGKAGFNIAERHACPAAQIFCILPGRGPLVPAYPPIFPLGRVLLVKRIVDIRSSGAHRLFRVEDRRKEFIVHLDEADGFFRCLRIDRCDSSDFISNISNFVYG